MGGIDPGAVGLPGGVGKDGHVHGWTQVEERGWWQADTCNRFPQLVRVSRGANNRPQERGIGQLFQIISLCSGELLQIPRPEKNVLLLT